MMIIVDHSTHNRVTFPTSQRYGYLKFFHICSVFLTLPLQVIFILVFTCFLLELMLVTRRLSRVLNLYQPLHNQEIFFPTSIIIQI